MFQSHGPQTAFRANLVPILLTLVAISCPSCRPAGESTTGRNSALPPLAEELKQMKQAGLPTRLEDLQATLPPTDTNAAPIYRRLVALLNEKPPTGKDKLATDFTSGKPLTSLQAEQLRRAFVHRADIGRLIHAAVIRPQCVFDRQWSQGPAMMFPEFAKLRVATRWLSAESALELYDGKPEAAIRTMALGFVIARHAAQDPMLIAYLVAIAIDSITLKGLDRVLYQSGERPGVARAVQRAIVDGWKPHNLAYGLRGEVVLPLVTVESFRKSGPEQYGSFGLRDEKDAGIGPLPALSADDRAHWGQFVDRSETAMLHMVHQLVEKADRPYNEADPYFKSVVAEVAKHKDDAAYTMARIIAPTYAQLIETRARADAHAATTRAAAMVLDWRSTHTAFPDHLIGVLPDVPIDPFSGSPVRYKREGKGFVVYSVGATGKFDGGDPAVKPDAKESLTRYPAPVYLK